MDFLTLYRGDYARIRKFEFGKTSSSCFVGQGIYLTDSTEVAETYREKGAPWDERKQTRKFEFMKAYPTKGDFKEELFKRFVLEVLKKKLEQVTTTDRYQFEDEIEKKKIIIQELSKPIGTPANHRVFNAVRQNEAGLGFLTKFKFPRRMFNDSVLHIHRRVIDKIDVEVMELLYQRQCFASKATINVYRSLGRQWTTKEVTLNSFDALLDVTRQYSMQHCGLNHRRARAVLEDLGYIGFEYNGGQNTGGKSHRAFCVWDDEFVNQHKIITSRLDDVVLSA